MELHRFLPFIHDDIPYIVWRMDRAFVGLYACSSEIGNILICLLNILLWLKIYFRGHRGPVWQSLYQP